MYWVGLLLILLFAVTLRWLPPSGYGGLRFLVLPALTLGMRSIAFLARMTRSAMLEALSADFVRTARAKGLNEWSVTLKHALRNALIPVITVLGLDFGAYLTGSILTETIFSWPGHRSLRRERHLASRSAGHSGHGALSQHRVRARQPDHRSRIRQGRSAGQL